MGFKDSVAIGVKLGHFLDALPWLGFETEALTATPHVMAGTLAIETQNPQRWGDSFEKRKRAFNLRVTTWAFTLLARYPGGTVSALCRRRTRHLFQPCSGDRHFMQLNTLYGTGGRWLRDQSSDSMIQVGLRYLLTNHVAMFGEWKFTLHHGSF